MIERLDNPMADARTRFNPSNPYVGPRPFTRGERLYGRTRETRDILNLLFSERLVLLYSPSGAGKTSLLEAAVIPGAEAENFVVLPPVRFRPAWALDTDLGGGNPYVAAVLVALSAPEYNAGAIPPAPAHTLQSYLHEERVRRGLDRSGAPMLLIFDQFEEILTEGSADPKALEAFFHELGSVLHDRRVYAIFSMREEHLGQLDRFLDFFPTKLATRYRIGFLDRRAAVSTIVGPACDHGVNFPEVLAYRLADDLSTVSNGSSDASAEVLRENLVEPLHIQVACYSIWENQVAKWTAAAGTGASVPEEAILDSGALDSMLGDYYARAVSQVAAETGISEQALRDWVGTKLITARGLRDLVLRDPHDRRIVRAADRLVDHLLVRRESRRGMVWYELSHDRFVRPIRQNNKRWLRQNGTFLRQRAERWLEHAKADAELLSADGVRQVKKTTPKAQLGPLEKEFLEASRARIAANRRKQRTVLQALGACLALVLVSSAFIYVRVSRDFWQAAWLVLDLRKELQSRVYHEVPREVFPLNKMPELPNVAAIPVTSRPATFGDAQRDSMLNEARAALQAELARGRDPRRASYSVSLPANTPAPVPGNLRALGYTVAFGGRRDGPANSLSFADDVPVSEVRLIALTYISGGGEIMRLRRFRTEGHSRIVTLDFEPDLLDWPAYTLGDLNALKPLPYPNDTRIDPAGSD